MKIINKFLTAVLSLSFTLSAFVMPIKADTALTYTLDEAKAGMADGTVTIPASAEANNVLLYWGDENGAVLEGHSYIHKFIKSSSTTATTAKIVDFSTEDISFRIGDNRLVPEGAKTLVANYCDADGNVLSSLSCAVPEANWFNFGTPNYTMFWVSDIHAQYYSYQTDSNQYKAIASMKAFADEERAKGINFKGVIANGDLANMGYAYEYAILEDIIAANNVDFPIYYTNGNHDTSMYGYDACAEAMEYRFDELEKLGVKINRTHAWSYDTYIEGQHYIFLAIPNGTTFSLTSAQEKWLETKICESENSGIPTYVFSHVPAFNTIPGSNSGNSFNVSTESANFKAIMKRHPGCMFITSHVHCNLYIDNNTLVEGDGVTYLDTSAVYNTYFRTGTGSSSKSLGSNSNNCGRYVMVYDDKIVIRSRNFNTNTWIPNSEYVVPVAVENKFEGKPSVDYTDLSVGSVLTAKLDGADIDTNAYNCEWYIGETKVGDGTSYTVAEENTNVALKLTDADGKYAWASTSYFDYTPVVDEGEDDDDVVIEVPEITYTNDNTVKYDGDIIYLEGNAGAANAGKTITLVIAPKNAYTDASTIKYINDCVIGSDGSYVFKFKAALVSEDDFLMAKIQSENVTNSVISAKTASEWPLEMTMTLDSTNTPVLSIQNKYKDKETVKVIIATYSAEKTLLDADIVDYDMAFGEYGQQQGYTYTDAVTGNTVKAFIWEGMDNISPLSQSVEQEIPVIEATEEVTE